MIFVCLIGTNTCIMATSSSKRCRISHVCSSMVFNCIHSKIPFTSCFSHSGCLFTTRPGNSFSSCSCIANGISKSYTNIYNLIEIQFNFFFFLYFIQMCKKDLVQLDFESILKYFRVSLPKKCRNEEVARQLMKLATSLKV